MSYILHRLRVMKAVAIVTFKEWGAYRTHSMVSIFVGPVYYLVQMCIWRAVYTTDSAIGGMTLNQMLTYSGVAAAIGYLTMDFADWNLQMLIHTGKYATFALRPIHHRFFALSQKVGHRFLGLIFEFIPVVLIFTLLFRVNLIPVHVGWALLSVGLGFMINFYVHYCIGIAGFWLTKTGGIRGVFQILRSAFSGALIPLSLFPGPLQKVLIFLPFQFITYLPGRIWTGDYTLGGVTLAAPYAVGLQALCALAMWGLSEVLYRLGNRKFTGVGV